MNKKQADLSHDTIVKPVYETNRIVYNITMTLM